MRRRTVLLGLSLTAVAGLGVLLWFMLFVDRLSEGELRGRVEQEVPLGATVDEIHAFLDEERLSGSGPYTASEASVLRDRGVAPDTAVVSASFRDTGPRWSPEEKNIAVYFLLGDDLRLDGIVLVTSRTFL